LSSARIVRDSGERLQLAVLPSTDTRIGGEQVGMATPERFFEFHVMHLAARHLRFQSFMPVGCTRGDEK
jgi:hypothetical protein